MVGLQISGLICSKAIGFRSSIELKSHKAIGPPPKAISHDFLISICISFFAGAHVSGISDAPQIRNLR